MLYHVHDFVKFEIKDVKKAVLICYAKATEMNWKSYIQN